MVIGENDDNDDHHQQPTTAAVSVDLEATPVPGQTGHAVLSLDGVLLTCGGNVTEHNTSVLFKMFVEAALLAEQDFQRLDVSFSSVTYSVARDETHVYVVQTKTS